MWIYSSLKWDTTASWTGATWQKLFSTASKHTKCSFSNSLTTYCTDGRIMCTTITQWQLLSYNSKSHSCWLLNYLMCWYINGPLWREKTRLFCCIIILDHPGPESVFKSWRKPLSFSVRSLTKLVQNRAKISHGSGVGLFSSPCIPGNVFLCRTTAKNIQMQQTSTHAASSAMSACQRGSMYGLRRTDGEGRDGERMADMQR